MDRTIIFTADDFSIRAGHADGSLMAKTVRWCIFMLSFVLIPVFDKMHMEELSVSLKLPNIKLVDGSSGGGSVTVSSPRECSLTVLIEIQTIRTAGWSYLPTIKTFLVVTQQLNAGIPNLGAILGPAIGLGAARVTACHFTVIAGDVGSLFNAGPNVVAGTLNRHQT